MRAGVPDAPRILRVAVTLIESVIAFQRTTGLVHCDLKPAQWFGLPDALAGGSLPVDGTSTAPRLPPPDAAPGCVAVLWRLGDFGNAGEPVNAAGLVPGLRCTPTYAAPEVLVQHAGSAAADVWSLARTLQELWLQRRCTCAPPVLSDACVAAGV